MIEATQDPGSFRDPSGYIFRTNDRVFRIVNERAREAYETVRDSGVLERLAGEGALIAAPEIPRSEWPGEFPGAAYVLEHPRIPLISYPYEWSFGALKVAALHHLDLQLELLSQGISLSDASAYNVQFLGPKPIFIDTLSLRPYVEGEFWQGHRQFCEQFLNPLLLRALNGIAHNAWYRGNLEGIPTADLARIVPLRKRLSLNIFSHVFAQAKLEAKATNAPNSAADRVKRARRLPLAGYKGILLQMRRWISRLHPADTGKTDWTEYAKSNSYAEAISTEKRQFVSEFVEKTAPDMLIDLGCSTGDYALAALQSGAKYVVGFDTDRLALDAAFSRAADQKLNFLPLCLDAANPSPNQGWRQEERSGFVTRARANALLALAFEHHLAIARNVPLPQLFDWLVGIAPTGVIEFVPKSDPEVQAMLAVREDIFDDYTEEAFEAALNRQARTIRSQRSTESGRVLYWYDRR